MAEGSATAQREGQTLPSEAAEPPVEHWQAPLPESDVVILGVSRSSLYYRAKGASEEVLSLMRDMNRQYLETPFYGSRRMRAWLDPQGMPVSRKWVQRSMRVMGLRAI